MLTGLNLFNIPEDRINDLFYSYLSETDDLNLQIYISKLKIKNKKQKNFK